jgi:glyoxylase-like metal-dependent hydrolase (beta-lactamase superfamily II)
MRRVLRIAAGLLGVLALALGAVLLAGQRGVPVPVHSSYRIDLAQLHELAQRREGARPGALNALVVGRGELPRGAVVAGQSWLERLPRVFAAFQILYPDGRSIVVDAPYATRDPAANDPAALRALEDGIARAESLLLTHTHDDHVLGLARSSRYAELKSKLALTRAQRDDPIFGIRAFPQGSLREANPLECEGSCAFAPGVALLAAPGHTQDSQIIYVELEKGLRYLILGDVVWDMENIETLTSRPRIIANTLLRGDEAKVAEQIRALHDLLASGAQVELVISHDARHLSEQIRSGRIGEGFSIPPS